jgi:transcription elongation factor Elf1
MSEEYTVALGCPHCGSTNKVERRRMSTAYVHEESNYLVSCLMCWEQSEADWRELWDEYWSMVMS